MLLLTDALPPVSVAAVGAKASQLHRLLLAGMQVPPSLVVQPCDPLASVGLHQVASQLGLIVKDGVCALAVRSSAPDEDLESGSRAGQYDSFLGAFTDVELRRRIADVRAGHPDMHVIVQPLLEAAFAGVAFSCDPITYERLSVSVTFTEGLADGLVAGRVDGATVNWSPTEHPPARAVPPALRSTLALLAEMTQAIEALFGGPVDVEWVLDRSGLLWIVQSRPVVLPRTESFALATAADFRRLSGTVTNHSKVRLRQVALSTGVPMARAAIHVRSHGFGKAEVPTIAEDAAGASIVLLHPSTVERKVIREFAGIRGSDVDFWVRECRRYKVRRYPTRRDLATAREDVIRTGLQAAWTAIAIELEILDAIATGIIQTTADGYVVELARGHFVPKGVVETSKVILDQSGGLIQQEWVPQSVVFHFIDGHVVEEKGPKEQLQLQAINFEWLIDALKPILDAYPGVAIEFGLARSEEGPAPYLIDVAESDRGGLPLATDAIASGVISPGVCEGVIVATETEVGGALDTHYHDETRDRAGNGGDSPVVVFAQRATVDLLPLVGDPRVRGFVFGRATLLCHLAVVIREAGKPAIALAADLSPWLAGADWRVRIDATSGVLRGAERVQVIENEEH